MRIAWSGLAGVLLTVASPAAGADGLVVLKSPYSSRDTMDRFEAAVRARGLMIVARIDHAAAAATVGQTLRPTIVLIFGHPRGGTPFMQCAQTVGIDLPLKALVWQDGSGSVWLGYNDPSYLARRHDVLSCPAAEPLKEVLAGLAREAVGP